jgi:hypothetical protein
MKLYMQVGGESNYQLVCRDANQAKNNLTIEEFVRLCRDVVDHFDKQN